MSYRIFMSEPTVGEAEALAAADRIRPRKITAGPAVADFERAFAEYVGMPEAVAVDTGTAALHLALLDAGIGPGDEVWVSDLTFIATANTVPTVARVTLVDSEAEAWNLDPAVVVEETSRSGHVRAHRCRRRSFRCTCSGTPPTSPRSSTPRRSTGSQ